MKLLKIAVVMLILIMSAGAVCAADDLCDNEISDDDQEILESTQENKYTTDEGSFTDLNSKIIDATDVLNITQDYKFNNQTDPP